MEEKDYREKYRPLKLFSNSNLDSSNKPTPSSVILKPGEEIIIKLNRGKGREPYTYYSKELRINNKYADNKLAERIKVIIKDVCKNKKEICKKSKGKIEIEINPRDHKGSAMFIRRMRRSRWSTKKISYLCTNLLTNTAKHIKMVKRLYNMAFGALIIKQKFI